MAETRRRRLLTVMFVVYLVVLVWVVLWKLHEPFIGRDDMREIKLVPFVSDGSFRLNAPVELAGNLLLFVPLGIYFAALVPAGRWWQAALVAAGLSVALEVIQFATAVGSSDVADVLVNTSGALAGFALTAHVRRRLGRRFARGVTWVLAVGTGLALVAVAVQIASFPRMPAEGDVILVSSSAP